MGARVRAREPDPALSSRSAAVARPSLAVPGGGSRPSDGRLAGASRDALKAPAPGAWGLLAAAAAVLVVPLSVSVAWALWGGEWWAATPLGLPLARWQHSLLGAALGLLAVLAGAGLLRRIEARQRWAEGQRRAYQDQVRFRDLVESTQDWFWEVDAQGRYTYCSPRCRELLGQEPQDLIGRSSLELVAAPEAVRLRALFGDAHPERGKQLRLEKFARHRDGHEVVLESRAMPIFDPAGRLLGYRGVDRDVTDRYRAEAVVRDLTARLEDRVRARTAELEYAYRELEAFSYSVSHDLRAPLRSIEGFAVAILDDCAEGLDDSGRVYLERIRGAAERMSQLIEDLLRLSRVTRQELRREPVDLSRMIGEIGRELLASSPERHVELVVQPGLAALGDAKLLRLAFANLLENAWKFTARCERARVAFGEGPDGALFVSDNGTGFDMAYAHKLFAPFQRLHTSAEFPGTGIGLAIVQRVVHRHGGRVWAEAAPGEGATFRLTLPRRA